MSQVPLLLLLVVSLECVLCVDAQALSGLITQGGGTLSIPSIESRINGTLATQLLFYNWCDSAGVVNELEGVWNSGGVPVLTVMWYACRNDSFNWVVADIADAKYDAVILEWALVVRQFVSPGRRIYLRPAHEMNGNWYPWGFQSFTLTPPAIFRKAFQRFSMMVRDASEASLTQLQVIFCVNDRSAHNGWIPDPDVAHWYPGDLYVDWVGIDGYNTPAYVHGEWWNVTYIFSAPIANIRSITAKPIAIPETGCDDEDRPQLMPSKGVWLRQLCELLAAYPIRMLIYFNVEKFEQSAFHYWSVASTTYRSFSTADYYTEWLQCMATPGRWVMSSGNGLLISDEAFQGRS